MVLGSAACLTPYQRRRRDPDRTVGARAVRISVTYNTDVHPLHVTSLWRLYRSRNEWETRVADLR
jgi:hypothetical protein